MIKYPKINSLYKRFRDGPFKNQFMDGRDGEAVQFSSPEYEALYYHPHWYATEKIDGTNVRLGFGEETGFAGRGDNSQFQLSLVEKLNDIHQSRKEAIDAVFNKGFNQIVLFGEGYGAKIQKGGGNYIPDGVDFILFDIWIDGIWLQRPNVEDIADQLNLRVVPLVFEGHLGNAEEMVREGFTSLTAQKEMIAEGLVLTTTMGLLDHMSRRIITKIKTVDYKE